LLENNELAFNSESQFEDIATMIDRDIDEVNLCITWYEQNGMIEIIDDVYCLSNWCKYQSYSDLDRIREQNKQRVARFREKKKQELLDVTHSNVTETLQETLPSYSISISNTLNSNSISNKELNSNKEYIKEIIDYLNKVGNKKYTYNSKTNNSHINARLDEGKTLEDFKKVIDIKWKQWGGTDMEKFFRPETLFSSAHFESYLNEYEEPITSSVNDGWDSL